MVELSETDLFALYNEHHTRIRGFILAKVSDEWVADDLVQETFVRAFRGIRGLKDIKKIRSWLFQIAGNLCADHFRSSLAQREQYSKLKRNENAAVSPGVEKEIEKHEMSACVRDRMKYLPESYRHILWLFDVMGLTQKEIAESLGLSIENVKVRLHRARKKMKAILNEHCDFQKDERDVFVCEPKLDAD